MSKAHFWSIFKFEIISRSKILADPVSIAIALRAAFRSNIQEGQLAYGFKKKPIDQIRAKTTPDIPEEKLFKINSKVIEFKKPKYSEEDEFNVNESDEEFGAVKHSESKNCDANGFYYSDLGYTDSKEKDVKFVKVPLSTTASPDVHSITESECTGRIINLPCKNCYAGQLTAEYADSQNHEATITR